MTCVQIERARWLLAVLLACAALAVSGCKGEGDGGAAPTSPKEPAAQAAAAPAADETAPVAQPEVAQPEVAPPVVAPVRPTVLAEPVPTEHVLPGTRERAPEDEQGKARRVMRVVGNYLLPHAAEHGAPADQAAAADVLKQARAMDWPGDPWGTPYVYTRLDETRFELSSAGPDREAGTADDITVTD